MTTELTVLTLAALLQLLQFLAFSVAANRQVGPRYAMSPRDEGRALTGTAGRLHRAMNNHFEGLILFSIAVMVITLSDGATALTGAAAWAYLVARILYVPAYVIGRGPWRSLIWSVGLVATIVILIAALM